MTDDKGTDTHAGDPARASKTEADSSASKPDERAAKPSADNGDKITKAATGSVADARIAGKNKAGVVAKASAQASSADAEKQSAHGSSGNNKSRGKDKGKPVSGQPPQAQDLRSGKNDRVSSGDSGSRQSSQEATTAANKTANKEATVTQTQTTTAPPDRRNPTPSGSSGGGSGGGGFSSSGGSEKRSSHSGGKLATIVAIVALVIAIIALLGAAWVWQTDLKRMVGVNNRIATLQNDVATDVRKRVESDVQSSIKPQLSKLNTQLGQVANASSQHGKTLAQLQQQLNTTRTQMADMAQRLQGSTRRWQLNQIEHLLITANRRLQLYEQPDQARQALQLASNSIARINDPRLFDVRKQVIDEIAALDALPSPDTEGIALTLTAFIKRVPNLPLASDVPDNFKPDAANGDESADDGVDFSSGWQHFVDSVGTALQSMATVRRADGTQPALLPPDQVYFLTQNLMLELRSARLALLEGNSTLYRASLPSAIKWLKQYFDTDDAGVSAMIDRLGQMQNIKLDWQAPDISASLIGLRDYMQKRSKEEHDASTQARHKNAAQSANGKSQKQSQGQDQNQDQDSGAATEQQGNE